jgi:DNA repair exonuclease SbcCD ATPase subunit
MACRADIPVDPEKGRIEHMVIRNEKADSAFHGHYATEARAQENADPLDVAGKSVLDLIQRAASAAKENSEHALDVARRLSAQLQAADQRIAELEAKIGHYQDRAERAENWLHQISSEIRQLFLEKPEKREDPIPPPTHIFMKNHLRNSGF